MGGIAFFDLDKTILSVSSGSLFFARQRRENRMNAWQSLQVMGSYLLYEVGLLDVDHIVRRAAAASKGMEEALMDARIRAFWDEEIKSSVRPAARRSIDDHKRRGDMRHAERRGWEIADWR